MLYQIESVRTRRNRKLIILYIVIGLLVFSVAIGLGMLAAQQYHKSKIDAQELEQIKQIAKDKNKTQEIKEEKHEDNQINDNNTLEQYNKAEFVKKVDDIYNGEQGKRVFLTFDDGPSESVTPYILDKLKEYNIKATFFVLGSRVELNPDLIKREYNEGHYVANHSYSHEYDKIYRSSNEVLKEYNKTEKAIKNALGNQEYSSNLFRFPGGSIGGEYDKIKRKAIKRLQKNNIAYLDWNALTNDAAGAYTKKEIMENLKQTVSSKNNVVILMHDAPDKILTYETLENIIKYLQKNGYAFKNMYDIMEECK